MKQLAFLTLNDPGDFVMDDQHAMAPLAALGWNTSVVAWRQTRVPWRDYSAVLIRSTWDYWDDVGGFLAVLDSIDNATRLANPLPLVRWNLAKTYLRELENKGIRIVPTLWPERLDAASLANLCDQLASDEVVIKPVVGANGVDAFRLARDLGREPWAQITARVRQRRFMVQAFMPAILNEGEYSLMFFNGEFSHAILKVPARGEFRSQEERGAAIHPVIPETALLHAARRALATIATPLYARIDMVRDPNNDFAVMEFELIEPSLYLRTDPDAPLRFARAVDEWFRQPGTAGHRAGPTPAGVLP